MSDNNWKSYVKEDDPDLSDFTNPPNPQDYDDTLKFSDCTHVLVDNKIIIGGRENCVDAVRGSHYWLVGCTLLCYGTAAIVFKGAISGWRVVDCVINPHGPTDINVGQFDNYWYPGRPATSCGIIFNTKTITGAPVRCQCWNADKPDIDCEVAVEKIPCFVWFPYFCWRFLWLRLTGKIPLVWKYDPPQTPTKNGTPQA